MPFKTISKQTSFMHSHKRTSIRSKVILYCFFTTILFSFSCASLKTNKPLKVLLVTGGCCHNYTFQAEVIKKCVPSSLPVQWTVVNEGGSGTEAKINLYNSANWASGYDLIIHNECFADTKDTGYIRKITRAHYEGANAVVIHCAMHSYRATEINDWREFLGVTTRRHDHQSNYPVTVAKPDHPVMKGLPATWTSAKDELYIIEKLWPNATALATSVSEVDRKSYPVAWANSYGRSRIFGTTFGHSDETFKDSVFLKLLSNGIIWAAERNP